MHDLGMVLGGGSMDTECCAKESPMMELRTPTIKEQLLRKKGQYEAKLKDINEAIEALTSLPKLDGIEKSRSSSLKMPVWRKSFRRTDRP